MSKASSVKSGRQLRVQRLVRRLWRVITPHRHSIYTRCFDCQMWGINFPDDPKCGNCGSTNTVEYYPTGSPSPLPEAR